MHIIGRKLYLNWGNLILAIEKYPITEELKAKVNFDEGNNISLFNIVDALGVKLEQYVGRPDIPDFKKKNLGHDVNAYTTWGEFWATEEEFKSISKKG